MTTRTALLIDGANMFAASRALNFFIDYRKLFDYLLQTNDIVRANYYTAVRDTRDTDEKDPIIPLIDWLSFNGYKMVTKPAVEYFNREGSVLKGNMDVQITVDALVMSDRIDHFILGSGDGDFVYLVDALHRKGLEVTAISTIETQPPMIASILRREVDDFIDLLEIKEHITRQREPR